MMDVCERVKTLKDRDIDRETNTEEKTDVAVLALVGVAASFKTCSSPIFVISTTTTMSTITSASAVVTAGCGDGAVVVIIVMVVSALVQV